MIRWDWIIIPVGFGFCAITLIQNSFVVGFAVTVFFGTVIRYIVEDQRGVNK